ncbi:hypothetical protein [Pseudoalteromonas denitrificans]|uniref:Phosphate ABC transporter substrate-binding protein n=1 Tax=Pseudoalteromonas denitrificans DSM 6059 TaxID=1123010 RepID=A0A1I1EQY9_9GAMM|nr:hypothetical protein [Pseudoalteromonas denitrificans]SFB89501.1 hypothetical protein SAMN02745724_00398 [Pseudoalteromonas denitrificans DSM 6059]
MKNFTKAIFLFSFIIPTSFAQENIWVITQKLSSEIKLSKQEVRQIYLGININLTDTITSSATTLSSSHQIRSIFNAQVIGLTESRLQSYWAHMRFSGRTKPPKEYPTINSLLKHLEATKGSIGYVPADTELPDNLIVIYPEN